MKIFFKYYLPLILWAGLIYYFSSLANLKSGFEEIWDFVLRKTAHILEFAVLAILMLRIGLGKQRARRQSQVYLLVLVFAIFYALSDEYHQSYVAGREMAVRDILIDSLGIIGGSGAYLAVRKS